MYVCVLFITSFIAAENCPKWFNQENEIRDIITVKMVHYIKFFVVILVVLLVGFCFI